ncbi:hypothetical protein FRB97_003599, partial [Tulasnella sp. 331]
SPSPHYIPQLASPGEKFSTSLGIDPALRVTYHPLVKKSKNATGSTFLSLQTKMDVTSIIQRVSVKNTRLADIQLSLKDQIPTSDNTDYKVILIEPELPEGRKTWTTPKNGVRSRWAPANDGDDDDNVTESLVAADTNAQAATNFSPGENGMIEWGCTIGAGRTVELTLAWDIAGGQNEVRIERLPSCLDKDSIRVEGLGNTVIFDVIYTAPTNAGLTVPNHNTGSDSDSNSGSDSDPAAAKALNEIKKRLAALQTQREVVKYQMDTLAGYAETLTTGQVDHLKLASFLELYGRRKRKLDEDLQSVDENIKSAQNLEKEQREALKLDDASSKRNVKVTIGATSAVTTAGSSKDNQPSSNNSLSVHYRASITQSTGEDWTDVAMDLSTASPHLSANIPSLATYHIGTPPSQSRSEKRKSVARFRSSSRAGNHYEYNSGDDDGDDIPFYTAGFKSSMNQMALVQSRAVEGTISTNFVIRGRSIVPSDPDTYHRTEHKVTVAEFELDPTLEWIAVPKMQASAFLRCRLRNTSPYVLLPGPTSVFMDGNFVCKSSLPLAGPGEKFSTSLGIDPALRVTYHPLVKKSKNATGSKFLSLQTKADVTSHIQRVSVKNTRLADIQLSLKDQIPTSDNADYKVILIEPTLQEGKKAWTTPRNGVKTRWAPANDVDEEDDVADNSVAADENAQAMNFSPGENGMIEWRCDIGAGRTIDLNLAWDIAVPRGETWASY